ncbi:MAG: hypothetical protein FWF38_02120 [Spirochaetaceae bacterium]|nr:hypothetical protein [Spirochaetaceae bacterium]
MKIKFILFAILIVFILASCYQAAGTDRNTNEGALFVKLSGGPMRAPSTAAGEIRVKFFEAGKMEEGKAYKIAEYEYPNGRHIDNAIFYLNMPVALNVNGKKITTDYFNAHFDSKNTTEIDNVPAGISLRMLVEYNCYDQEHELSSDNTSYLSHAGVSEPFTVKKDSATTVDINLNQAAYGTVLLDDAFGVLNVYVSVAIMAVEEFDRIFTIDGNKIVVSANTSYSGQLTSLSSLELLLYKPGSSTSIGIRELPMLPGKRLRLMIIQPNATPRIAGLSQSFELAPGEERQIAVDWSYTALFC